MSDDHVSHLGHGVSARRVGGGDWIVACQEPVFDWRPRAGPHVGTAVLWDESVFEVTEVDQFESGWQWHLAPWPEGEAVRVTVPLSPESVAETMTERQQTYRGLRKRLWLTLILPLVGMLPASHQQRLANETGFAATRATAISAFVEVLLGSALLLQLVMVIGADSRFLPDWLVPFSPLGPILWAEGLVRLVLVISTGDPVGTVFGLLAHLFWPVEVAGSRALKDAPIVHLFDDDEGVLELLVTLQRRDWEDGGILPYRGTSFRRTEVLRHGSRWLYRFRHVQSPDVKDEPTLRLLPPPLTPVFVPPAPVPIHPFRTGVRSAAMCLAPTAHQERWALGLSLSPFWFTAVGACAELLGGVIELPRDLRNGSPWALLDLVFIVEGVVRIGCVTMARRSLGSIFGLPLIPWTKRWAGEMVKIREEAETETHE
ncbi:MAG: hypothetical protein GY906_34825 [bacterium]|nr:hypothetical protein [bacterium]